MLNEYNVNVDLEKVKKWYNGYFWLKEKLYNPFDILLFISEEFKYKNYWYSNGTPTFLKELLVEKNYFLPELSNISVSENTLESSEIEDIDIEGLFFQSGYLTIEEEIVKVNGLLEYRLRIPNYEVQLSIFNHLAQYLSNHSKTDRNIVRNGFEKVLSSANQDKLESILSTMYSKIPYNNLTRIANYEGYYASVLYTYLMAIGMEIIAEDVTNKGKEIYSIGIKFNSELRNVSKVVWAKILN